MKLELSANVRHLLEPEFVKEMYRTSARVLNNSTIYHQTRSHYVVSPIFLHFDVRFVIFRQASAVFLEFSPFSQTLLHESQTFSPYRGMTHPSGFQTFRQPAKISFLQSSSFPVSTFTLGF